MRCSVGEYGQPLCNVVDHPDRSIESFCATCGHRFVKREASWGGVGLFSVIVALFFLLLSALSRPTFDEVEWDGANDIPASNVSRSISASLPPPAQPVAERVAQEVEDSVSKRIIDLPISEQIDYLNGGDRITLSQADNES